MLTYDFMSYKGKFAIAAIATLLGIWLILGLIWLIPITAAGDAPLAFVIIAAVVALLWITVCVWLWERAVAEYGSATGRLYPGEKVARQLHAEHGGELIYGHEDKPFRHWTVTVQGADGFNRTILTRNGKEVS